MNGREIAEVIKRSSDLQLRQVVALEKIARCLSALEELLFDVHDGSDKSIRTKNVERGKVYSTHLGGKLRRS